MSSVECQHQHQALPSKDWPILFLSAW